jgi:type I restriction enzyme S subunit
MVFELQLLEDAGILLIDGDRGKNYPKQADFMESGHCLFLSAKNVTNTGFQFEDTIFVSEERDNILRAGKLIRNDIVLTTRGTIGNVAFYGPSVDYEHIRINSGMIIVRCDERLWNPRFLYFLFTSQVIRQQIEALTSGSAVPQLPARDLKKFRLPNIPKATQDNIVEHVGGLSDKLDLNLKINQTLEKMAQTLFKSWFVDFDPVIDNALTAGNPIPDELAHRVEVRRKAHALPDFQPLPEHIRSFFPSEFDQTGEPTVGIDGWIPKGWHVSTTKDEFDIRGGATPSTKNEDFWDGDINWTSPKDLSGNHSKVLLDTSRKITDAGLAKITSGLLPLNTVLMSSRAPVGYLALAKVPVAINQGYIALLCEKNLTPEYTLLFLDSVMEEIKGISGGTTFAEISKKTFKGIKILVPSTQVLEAFTTIAKVNYDKITDNVKQIESLIETRDYLLPKLISGEVSLGEGSHE